MTTEIYIDLNLIRPNPFQPRKEYLTQELSELVENIERNTTPDFDGLLQAPTARKVGTTYELAFGHRRWMAMQALGRGEMRLQIRDLTDLQMFEIAVSENMKRKDLNPIEEAEAIQTYMEKFGKTSEEAAAFFGKAASTIRGMVRLLNLPEAAQEKVRSGEINTAGARALLVVAKVAGESGVEDVLERMEQDNEGPLEAISDTLQFHDATWRLRLDEGWVTANPFPPKHLPPLKVKEIHSALIAEDESELDGKEEDAARLVALVQAGMEVTDEAFGMFDEDGLERVRVLANPPGCLGCPLHAQLDGDHFCGMKLCADRKQAAWWQEETETEAQKRGVPVYEKARDGAFETLNAYNSETKKLLTAAHEDVRLKTAAERIWGNSELDLPDHVQMVVVGKTAEKLRKKDEKTKEKETARVGGEDWRLTSALQNAVRTFCVRWNWEMGSEAAAVAFNGVTSLTLMKDLLEIGSVDFPEGVDDDALLEGAMKAKKKADGLAQMRRLLGMWMLDMHFRWNSNDKKALVQYAKGMGELIKAWGGKLPKDWDAQALTYQTELEAAWKEIRAGWEG